MRGRCDATASRSVGAGVRRSSACDGGRERRWTGGNDERDDPAEARWSTGNTRFALDLYARLKGGDGNLFFSPYSSRRPWR